MSGLSILRDPLGRPLRAPAGRPDARLSPADAVSRAEEAFADACDLNPEEAAEIYAAELPPGDVGCLRTIDRVDAGLEVLLAAG